MAISNILPRTWPRTPESIVPTWGTEPRDSIKPSILSSGRISVVYDSIQLFALDKMWKHNFRGKALVTAVTACSCQAFLLLGYDQGVMSGIIGAENRFARDFGHPDADMQGNIVGLYDVLHFPGQPRGWDGSANSTQIGCIIGSILVFFIGEHFGRRVMLMAGGSIMIIGSIILATSTTIAQLIVGRIVTGIVCDSNP